MKILHKLPLDEWFDDVPHPYDTWPMATDKEEEIARLYEEGDAVNSSLHLPYYTATAWYHKSLNNDLQSKDLNDILPGVENFTINELIPAIAKGGFISGEEKNKIAEKYSYYSGLSKEFVLSHNLDVPNNTFLY